MHTRSLNAAHESMYHEAYKDETYLNDSLKFSGGQIQPVKSNCNHVATICTLKKCLELLRASRATYCVRTGRQIFSLRQ